MRDALALDSYHIQSHTPFRDSILWKLQQNYFKYKGITAWQGEVPFYISSNAAIAQQYAEWVISAIRDVIALHPEYNKETFHIMELGVGVGKFSFYFLKAFFRLYSSKDTFNIQYIMTDVASKNKDFWEKNSYFLELKQKNCLEFALVNLEGEGLSDIKFSKKTPLIVIANYVFDCIKQDVFEIDDGRLNEIQVQIKSRYKNYDQSKAEHLKELQFDYRLDSIESPYNDFELNSLLKVYQAELFQNSIFTFPIGAINFLKQLEKITHNNYIMIVGDKGIAKTKEWLNISQDNVMSYEGCYAFMLNLDILGHYIKSKGGDCLLTSNSNVFKVCLYSSQYKFSALKNASHFFTNHFERFGPDEFCYLNEALKMSCYGFSLKTLMGYLRLSCWDTEVYQNIHDRLIDLVSYADVNLSSDLITDLNKVAENIYYYPGSANIYNQLGIFYQAIKYPDKAIEWYQKALLIWGETVEPNHNLGMIYESLDDKVNALKHYRQAITLSHSKQDMNYAKRRIQILSGTSFLEMGKIIGRALLVLAITAAVLYYIVVIL